MAGSGKEWQVHTTWGLKELLEQGQPIFVSERFAIPEKLDIPADRDGEHLEIRVQIENGRARSRRVLIESSTPGGVSATTLRQVPIRNVVATACLSALLKVQTSPDGTVHFMPGPHDAADVDEIRRVVQELVGYVEAGS